MEIQFDDEPKKGPVPGTRVYAPASGGAAPESVPERKQRRKAEAPVETVIDEDGFRIRVPKDEIKASSRIGIIISAFVLAGMILFTLTGYERISRAYADINTLKNEIELTKLRIAELDVAIECAVTIQQAQQVAEQAGMTYPTQSQYVRIGSQIPVTAAQLAVPVTATAPDAGTTGDTATAPNGTDGAGDMDDVTTDANGLPVETETN